MSEWKVSDVQFSVKISCGCVRGVAVKVVNVEDVFRALKTTSNKLRVEAGVS